MLYNPQERCYFAVISTLLAEPAVYQTRQGVVVDPVCTSTWKPERAFFAFKLKYSLTKIIKKRAKARY